MSMEFPNIALNMTQVKSVLMDRLVDVESTLVSDVVVNNVPPVFMDTLRDYRKPFRERGILLSPIARDQFRAIFIWNKELP